MKSHKEIIKEYIVACENNVRSYTELGDTKGVEVALGMIAEFKKLLENL